MKLCTPSLVYLVLAIIALFFNMQYSFKSTILHVIFIVIWALLLNWLCKKGMKWISWALVILPYIFAVLVILIATEMKEGFATSSKQILSLTPEQIGSLTPELIKGLTPEQIAEIPPQLITSISPELITSISPEIIAVLPPQLIKLLTPEQIKSMTTEQREKLDL